MTTALRPQRFARAASAAPLRLLRARTPEEIGLLEGPWRDLDAEAGCPSSQFSWTRACLRAFAEDGAVQVTAVARGSQLAAVAPLIRTRRHGVHRLFLAGVSRLHEPTDWACADTAAMERLTLALARSRHPLVFERMPAESPAVAALGRACRGRALVMVRPEAAYPYIALDESWVEPEQHLNAHRRSDLCRARRKAEQLGPLSIEFHSPGLHELPALLDTAFAIEATVWTDESRTALEHDLPRAVFYRQYAEAACVEGTLRVCFLRIGGRVAAMQVAVETGGGFWLLKAGYDERFVACSPGQLLLRETIRYAAEAGLGSFEFWGQTERGTRFWTPRVRACVALRVYPFGVRGLSALVADAAVGGWRTWTRP